jgi:hypothetical protein
MPKDRLTYEYDFGDSWDHLVVLEETLPAESACSYPRLLAGKRACPPEDVGGIPGYEHFLQAIADPRHPEHAEWREWYGPRFDPDQLDIDAVNHELETHWRRSARNRAR